MGKLKKNRLGGTYMYEYISYGKTEQSPGACIYRYIVGELEGETLRLRLREDEFKRNFKEILSSEVRWIHLN
jgi:hypothetical protein